MNEAPLNHQKEVNEDGLRKTLAREHYGLTTKVAVAMDTNVNARALATSADVNGDWLLATALTNYDINLYKGENLNKLAALKGIALKNFNFKKQTNKRRQMLSIVGTWKENACSCLCSPNVDAIFEFVDACHVVSLRFATYTFATNGSYDNYVNGNNASFLFTPSCSFLFVHVSLYLFVKCGLTFIYGDIDNNFYAGIQQLVNALRKCLTIKKLFFICSHPAIYAVFRNDLPYYFLNKLNESSECFHGPFR